MTILFVLIAFALFCGLIYMIDGRSVSGSELASYLHYEYNMGNVSASNAASGLRGL